MPGELLEAEGTLLLGLARQALRQAVQGEPLPAVVLADLPPSLHHPGASFVTLLVRGELRGCVGTLDASQTLVESVVSNTVAAAFSDPRFPPVLEHELPGITIELACLTALQPLPYQSPEELVSLLRPGVDGLVLQDGVRRATFLPKVWEKISNPAEFLEHLCQKMGAVPDLWRHKHLEVFVYQTETFSE